MLALWVGFVLSLLLVLVPSLYTSCIPLGVLFNTIAYQSKKKISWKAVLVKKAERKIWLAAALHLIWAI